LLQYEIDTHMVDLASRYGEPSAVLAYRACSDAIDMLADKAAELRDVDFARMRSLYFASRRSHTGALRQEFELRRRHGFEMTWLERGDIEARYGFSAPAAILSRQAARVDPYRMAYKLLARIEKAGAAVHDRSAVTRLDIRARGATLETSTGGIVRAKHVVIAAGYASQQYLDRKVAKNRSSYAFATDPIEPGLLGELSGTMVWESARPYLYLRATGDGRLVVGGDDDSIDIPSRRDARVDVKAARLAGKVGKLFPRLPVEPAFAWAGTFAETEDGLPWFGSQPRTGPRMLFAMAYGGNGITYSMLGAGLIRAMIEKRKHPLSGIFGFDRMT
jgi:glycine/D-amino acid oxidase-like deaminating enzyme